MAKKKESIHLNAIETDHIVQTRPNIPDDYHCDCGYCRSGKFLGEIFHNDSNKYYSNRIRKSYYVDGAGDHLDAGHLIGYRFAIQQLTKEGDWVFDPTCGTGTAIIEAINNGRNGAGIELEYPHVTHGNILAQKRKEGTYVRFKQGNAIFADDILDDMGFKPGDLSMIINGTPYPKLSGKSSDAPERKNLKTGQDKSFDYYHEENIGITKGEEYWNLVTTMYKKSIGYLKSGGYFVILIKDMVQNKEAYLLHKEIIDRVLETNRDMEHYGMFIHSHQPRTMFINTYTKRFPNIKIPLYQTGVILKKKF